jgi:rhamnulose-1-phosphate aldolase
MDPILNVPVMQELIRTCSNMYRLGWNERNGGNISILLDDAELLQRLDNSKAAEKFDLRFDAGELAGSYFAVTRTGSYFKNIEYDPAHNLGIIRISPDGKSAALLWGLTGGGRPTSELPAHLRSHSARLRLNGAHRVVTHCHPANTVAMTYILELSDREFTRALWRMETECIIVFPEGIGVLPWMLCGTDEIGRATEKKMESYRLCVWGQHGIFAAGDSLDEAFGLIETVEKAAEIYIKTGGRQIINTIDDGQLAILAEAFGVRYRKEFLN